MPGSRMNEFSRPLALAQIGDKESRHALAATPAEREALARRLALLGLGLLEGEMALRRLRGGKVLRVVGRLSAEVVQACVVTLEPVPARLEADFAENFALEAVAGEELLFDPADEDAPEPFGPELLDAGGTLDLGELLVQLLAERLDPYPRRAGVSLGEAVARFGPAEEEGRVKPFADLERKLGRH